MLCVNIIGAGKVGRSFMALIAAAEGIALGDVASRRPESARDAVAALGAGRAVSDPGGMRPADLWILAVPDDAIAGLARDLAALRAGGDGAAAIHCSGFLSSAALQPLRARGWAVSIA